jgi:hypothetical protein
VNATINRQLRNRKRRIDRRLDKTDLRGCSQPMLTARNIHYEISDRIHGIAHGGIGAFHLLARKLGLIERIDQRLHLLKIHLPYHESDHVLAIAYNALCDGTCLQDLELRRQDENFLDALGARRIPDPTTAGDFCRRFDRSSIDTLLDIIDDTRLQAWAAQPDAFFEQAVRLVVNNGQAEQSVSQTLAVPGNYQYSLSVWARTDGSSGITLAASAGSGSASTTFSLDTQWKRISIFVGMGQTAESVTFEARLAAGAAVQLFGMQVEAQLAPSDYKKTGAHGGVISHARFAADQLSVRAQGTDVFDAVIGIVKAGD